MKLKKQITDLLKNTKTMIKNTGIPELDILKDEISHMENRLNRPLRVAVAGFMKAGKSTLMNAILREKLLFTGFLVTTYRVTWFKFGEIARIEVVLKNGHIIQEKIENLEKWTVMDKLAENPQIKDVGYIIIYYPNEILKSMELIDTPGLFSPYDDDSENTLDFLGLTKNDLNAIHAEQISNADAIIYVFEKGFKQDDLNVVKAFTSSAINAIGIMSKVDSAWECLMNPDESPLTTVDSIVKRLSDELKENLYTIFPVTALCVESASDIDDRTWAIFQALSKLEMKVLLKRLSDASSFERKEFDDMPVGAEDRKYVNKMYGQYGIFMVVTALKNGVDRQQLVEYLFEKSGVNSATDVIFKHFGNRSFLIKQSFILSHIKTLAGRLMYEHPDNASLNIVCTRVCEDIDKIMAGEQAFKELDLLKMYYKDEIQFTDREDEKQFLQITGENGSNCEAKLGFTDVTTIREMKKTALERSIYWNGLSNDLFSSRIIKTTATIIVRSYNSLFEHLDALSGYEE